MLLSTSQANTRKDCVDYKEENVCGFSFNEQNLNIEEEEINFWLEKRVVLPNKTTSLSICLRLKIYRIYKEQAYLMGFNNSWDLMSKKFVNFKNSIYLCFFQLAKSSILLNKNDSKYTSASDKHLADEKN